MCFGLQRARRRLGRRGARDQGGARRQRLADHRAQDLDLQLAGRRLLHRLRHHRSRARGGAQGRHLGLPRADRVAGLRGPAHHQAVRPYRRRRGRAAARGRAGRAVAAGRRTAPGLRRSALYGVSLGRIYNSARAVGYGRWALEKALDYAKQRQAFGKAIAEYQGVTFPLAESAMELHAAHLMGLNVASLLDQGAPAVKELADGQGLRGAGRLQGGRPRHADPRRHGLHQRARPAPRLAHLRIVNVADGTNEILNRSIVQRLLKGDVEL